MDPFMRAEQQPQIVHRLQELLTATDDADFNTPHWARRQEIAQKPLMGTTIRDLVK